MLSFVGLSTKFVFVQMHGLAGVLVLWALALFAASAEGSFSAAVRNFRHNRRGNQLLLLFAIWYSIGVFAKMYLLGSAATDWRLTTAPLEIMGGLLFSMAYLHQDRCARIFQVTFAVMVGAQSVATGWLLIRDFSIVRIALMETMGGWSYGDQGGFAMQAMVLPILVWRALRETGWLRLVLVVCVGAIGFAAAASQFATSFALLLGSIPVAMLLAFRYTKHRARLTYLLPVFGMALAGWIIFEQMQSNPLFADAGRHLVNLWNDPTSGGYQGLDAQNSSRSVLAKISIATFRNNPFFGAGSGSIHTSLLVGGHSAFFDMLGFYGLLGGAGAFIGFLVLMTRTAFRRLRRRRDWESVAVATSVILLVIGGVVNPYWEGGPTVIVFLLGRLFRMPPPTVPVT